ncbi:MAG: ribonuclease Z [candidate division NC10 bacterium]|nr:ribonuclease Z [candidate division NC10 bacterium]
MKPLFHSKLISGPFGDPGLFVDLQWEGRALLFDLGGNEALESAKLVRVSDVFVSHTHVDHFIGFDNLLRVLLGRDKTVRIFGPPGIVSNIEGKLAGYTWNLVEGYKFSLEVHEVHEDRIVSATFNCSEGFTRKDKPSPLPFERVLVDDPLFTVEAVHLDHRIPCMAFALSEKFHININKDRLTRLNMPVGPWLGELKKCIREGRLDDSPFIARWRRGDKLEENEFLLGELKEKIVMITEGQKVSYVVDALYSEENAVKIISLVKDSDIFYCEAGFLEKDVERARERYHLTAKQAGLLARKARVKRLEIFHFSPKYESNPLELYQEAMGEFYKTP